MAVFSRLRVTGFVPFSPGSRPDSDSLADVKRLKMYAGVWSYFPTLAIDTHTTCTQ